MGVGAMNFLRDEMKRTVLCLCISLVSIIISFFDLGHFPMNAAWIAILLCGIPIIRGAIVGLVTEFDIKADVLVSIALVASVAIGEIFAAGEVAFIMTIGAYLEDRTVRNARAGIEKLVQLSPTTARVVRQGEESIIPAQEVEIGDIIRVFAGETIAVDGIIESGQTAVDQSIMTGESLPVDKIVGDEVLSGTVNQFGTFDMVAQKVGEDSSLQKMIRLVESADAGKAKIVGVADRWATWIVVIALLAAVLTWFMTREIIRSVTILVVFCPCALVLATPTAIMAGIGNASKYGILVSQGDALERLAKVSRIAFDKTGTLTVGRPAVVSMESCVADMTEEQLLHWAAVAESRSEHPIGKAIVNCFIDKSGNTPEQPEEFQLTLGRGVTASMNGREIFAGNGEMLIDYGVPLPDKMVDSVKKAAESGSIAIYIAEKERVLGVIVLSDTIRTESPQLI